MAGPIRNSFDDDLPDSLYEDLLDDDDTLEEGEGLDGLQPIDEEIDETDVDIEDDDAGFFDNIEDQEDEDFEDEEDEESEDQEDETEEQDDLITSILKSKGIDNPEKIKYEDETGEIVEVNFYDLDKEEQLAILNSNDSDINYGLSDHELEVVNYLRNNKVSFQDTIEYFSRQAIEDYIRDSYNQGFSIDSFDDEELFKLDLKSQYEDLTEEEVQLQLEKELEHRELFDKKIKRIRQEYLEAEATQLEEQNRKEAEQREEEYSKLNDSLKSVATSVSDIGGLDLSDEDKNEVLSFILDRDMNGVSDFIKLLDDSEQLFQLAWFALKGQEAFNTLHDYYKKQISVVRKQPVAKQPSNNTDTRPVENTQRKRVIKKKIEKVGQSKNPFYSDSSLDGLYE